MDNFITVSHDIGGDGFNGPRRTIHQKVIDNQRLGTPGQFVYIRFKGGVGRTQRDRRGGATLWFVPKVAPTTTAASWADEPHPHRRLVNPDSN